MASASRPGEAVEVGKGSQVLKHYVIQCGIQYTVYIYIYCIYNMYTT